MSMTKMDSACDHAWDKTDPYLAEAMTVGNSAIELLQYLADHCDLSCVKESYYAEGYHEKQLIEISNILKEWNS